MKTPAAILIMILMSLFTHGQNLDYPKGLSLLKDKCMILDRPVTNREYITYLMWLSTVYVDYPSNLINAFPLKESSNVELVISEYYNSKTPYQTIFKYCPEFVKNYMFNPKYIDYPVIGLSWNQANRFNKWLTDRWNENKLIELKHYTFNKFQTGEDCFTTESYLADQYYGSWNGIDKVNWSDRILLATFTLPTSQEVKNSNNLEFKEYPYDSTNFINSWINWLLIVADSSITLNHFYPEPEKVESDIANFDFTQFDFKELTLDIDVDKSDKLRIFEKVNQNELNYSEKSVLEKDSIGGMRYMILGDLDSKTPLIIEYYPSEKPEMIDSDIMHIFRYSFIKE